MKIGVTLPMPVRASLAAYSIGGSRAATALRAGVPALVLALSCAGPALAAEDEGDDVEIEVEASPAATVPTETPVAPPSEAVPPPAAAAVSPGAASPTPPPESPERPTVASPAPKPAFDPAKWLDPRALELGGYVQVEYIHSEQSEDALSTEGDALNQDRFLVRRTRLRVDRRFRIAHVDVEIDANTVRGPALDLRHAEASLFLPERPGLPTPVAVTAGLSDIPFGAELTEGSRRRVFMERTLGSRAFFAGEPDLGVQLGGALGPFRYALAAQNGQPVGDNPSTATLPFLREKTFAGRVGVQVGKPERAQLVAGASVLTGQGFHEGTTATKSTLTWSDANEDGFVTLDELQGVQGQAATASSRFDRFGLDVDASFVLVTPAGATRLFGEATLGTNLDRNYFVADPVSTGYDVRELAWSVGATQDVTRFGLVGFRAENYNPSSDLFDAQRGLFLPLDASVLTLSPVAGIQYPGLGRILVQYDYVVDHLGRDVTGLAVDLPNDQLTAQLQVEF